MHIAGVKRLSGGGDLDGETWGMMYVLLCVEVFVVYGRAPR